MKIVNIFLAAAVVMAAAPSFAASVCTLDSYYYTCDGKNVSKDLLKGLNTTAILQDLVSRGYKIAGIVSPSSSQVFYTLVKE